MTEAALVRMFAFFVVIDVLFLIDEARKRR